MRSIAALCLGATFLCISGRADAAILEEIIQLPVRVTDMRGTAVNHTITVTIFHDSDRSRSPFLILNHGRASGEADRAKLGRARFTNNARYFVSRGFAVFVPTRIGYGVTGGPDVEYSGNCNSRNYPPVYEAAAQQSLTLLHHAKTLPYVDPQKGLVVGQSFGGATAIALAAKKISGVLAAINFAGGGGGNPKTRPERPCRDDLIADLFASYGASARIPTLWLYSENDQYWGKDKPKVWFERFIKRGGSGQFVQLPPAEDDGHRSFTSNPAGWRPAFEQFLRTCCQGSFAE